MIRIIPNGLICNGTKVLDCDGNEIKGITKIELIAESNSVWRATIHCKSIIDGEIIAEIYNPKEELKSEDKL